MRISFVTRFLHAAALGAIVLTPGAASAQDCTTDARRVVDAIYQQVLQRASQGESAAAAGQLARGETSVRTLVSNMAKSQEHQQRFLAGTGAQALNNAATYLYRHLLGREPDAGGLQSHAQALSRGDVGGAVDSLANSAEYQEKFGDDTVPGSGLRYCGSSQSSQTSPTSAGAPSSRNRFGTMDGNNNGTIERGEWNGSRASFDTHDWNRDGVLSGDEVTRGARRTYGRAEDEDFDPNGAATWSRQNFTALDGNRDNRIRPNEWYYSAESFRRADRNGDGTLTLTEFTDTSWDDDRDDRFENLDMNGNGRVERSEWHGALDAFSYLDANRDGSLSRSETAGDSSTRFDSFSSLDRDRNGRIESGEWRWSARSFERADTNNDGALTRREFALNGGAPTAPAR